MGRRTASYEIISPTVSAVRADTSSTLTLYSTNQYGRTSASVTIKVR
jgi:hypothetical protein